MSLKVIDEQFFAAKICRPTACSPSKGYLNLCKHTQKLSYLGLEVPEDVKVKLEVSGQDALDDEKAEPLQLRRLQILEKIVFWVVGK